MRESTDTFHVVQLTPLFQSFHYSATNAAGYCKILDWASILGDGLKGTDFAHKDCYLHSRYSLF